MHHSYKTALYRRWSRRFIKLYPTLWYERYAEEMLQILEDSEPTLKTVLNLFINLFDAYSHRNLVNGRNTHMLQRIRSNELTIYGATLIFYVAYSSLQLHTVLPGEMRFGLLNFTNPASSSLSVNIVHIIAYLLLLFILLGGLPILLAACWKAVKTHNIRALLLCLLSIMSPLITAFLAAFSLNQWRNIAFIRTLAFTRANVSTSLSLCVAFAGLVISLALILFAVQHVAPSRRITHYAFSFATVIPLVMLVGIVSLLVAIQPFFAIILAQGDTIYLIREYLLILVMILALSFSLLALRKIYRAKKSFQDIVQEEATVLS